MPNVLSLLPLVNLVLLAALSVSAARLITGAPTLRERLAWSSIAIATACAIAGWLFLFLTVGMEAFTSPLGNLIRWVVTGSGVLTLVTIAPTLHRQRAAASTPRSASGARWTAARNRWRW